MIRFFYQTFNIKSLGFDDLPFVSHISNAVIVFDNRIKSTTKVNCNMIKVYGQFTIYVVNVIIVLS